MPYTVPMTQTIGSDATARALFSYFKGDPYDNRQTSRSCFKRAPKGFRRIGSGCYRVAFLDVAANVVYKMGQNHANIAEAENAERLANMPTDTLPFDLVIPATRVVEIDENASVIVQQFAANARPTDCMTMYNYEGFSNYKCTCKRKGLCFGDMLKTVESWSGLGDIHCYNVLMDRDERFWLIDLAG